MEVVVLGTEISSPAPERGNAPDIPTPAGAERSQRGGAGNSHSPGMLVALGHLIPSGSVNPGRNLEVLGGFQGFLALELPREWGGNDGRTSGMPPLPVPREGNHLPVPPRG